MNQYKISNYNHFYFIESEQKYLIYNSISNGLAKLEPEIYNLLKAGDEGVAKLAKDESKKELITAMLKGHLIVDKDYDEIEFLRTRFNMGKYGQKNLSLTILSTDACNMKCQYCYQGERPANYPYDGLEDDIVNFAKERILTCGYRALSLTWYGGEPLLNKKYIFSLSDKLIKLCKEHHVTYGAMIVTNGTLLNKKTAISLKSRQVKSMQITIDGPQVIHDARRGLKDSKKSSFTTIMKNVGDVFGIIPITVRVNVDKTNINNTMELLEIFKEKGYLNNSNDLSVYLGYTREWTNKCRDILPTCFSMNEFSQAEIDFQKKLIASGFTSSSLYPRHQSLCSAVTPHGFVIEPTGDIHKCWSDINNPEAFVGHVKAPLQINGKIMEWLAYDPLAQSSGCRQCGLFPICGGGCPYVPIKQKEKLAADKNYNCTPWKMLMEEKLQVFLQSKAQELANK